MKRETASTRWQDLLGLLLSAGVCAAYLLSTIRYAARAPLTVDEISVKWMIGFVPKSEWVHAVTRGADGLPLLAYPVMGLFTPALGLTPLALRLPSVVAFLLLMFAGYAIAARRGGPLLGALALGAPCLSAAFEGATTARPYAIVGACFAWAVALWVADSERVSRRRSVAIALCIALALAVHYYAILLVPCLAALELVWSVRHKAERRSHWIAYAAGCAAAITWAPVILGTYHWAKAGTAFSSTSTVNKPSLIGLAVSLHYLFFDLRVWIVLVAVAIAATGAWLLRTARGRTGAEPPQVPALGDEDLDTALLGVCLLPFVVYLFAAVVTHVFYQRYFYGSALALSIVTARAIPRFRDRTLIATAGVVITCGLLLQTARGDHGSDPRVELIATTQDPLPIVFPRPGAFLEVWDEGSPSLQSRVAFVNVPAGEPNVDRGPEFLPAAWRVFRTELPVYDGDTFIRRHPRFYMIVIDPVQYPFDRWVHDHARATLLARVGDLLLLEVEVADRLRP